jgi:endonuclease III
MAETLFAGASLRLSQLPAQDSAEHPLPKQGRQASEVEEELQEELQEELEEEPKGLLFATHGRPACEDLDARCRESSTAECWKS